MINADKNEKMNDTENKQKEKKTRRIPIHIHLNAKECTYQYVTNPSTLNLFVSFEYRCLQFATTVLFVCLSCPSLQILKGQQLLQLWSLLLTSDCWRFLVVMDLQLMRGFSQCKKDCISLLQ